MDAQFAQTQMQQCRVNTLLLLHLPHAGMIQGMTAVAFATMAHPIQPGNTVLIHAAAGGTGQLLAQVGDWP
jgi:NADPH:quinone reductase-like Zn-dependent oxidoreductase